MLGLVGLSSALPMPQDVPGLDAHQAALAAHAAHLSQHKTAEGQLDAIVRNANPIFDFAHTEEEREVLNQQLQHSAKHQFTGVVGASGNIGPSGLCGPSGCVAF